MQNGKGKGKIAGAGNGMELSQKAERKEMTWSSEDP